MERQVAAAVLLVLLTGPARGQGGPPSLAPRVAAIDVRLPPGEDPAQVRDLLALAPGDPLRARALRRTVQLLYQTGRWRQITAWAIPAEPPPGAVAPHADAGGGSGWVHLVLLVEPVRRVTAVVVSGSVPPVVGEEAVRAAARLRPGDPFDDSDLRAAEVRVSSELARRGWRTARVEARTRQAGEVELSVEPGDPVRVGEVRFTGDPGPASGALGEALRARRGQVLDLEALAADVETLRVALRLAGHGRARVLAPVVRAEGLLADLEVPVEAGPRVELLLRGNAEVEGRALLREVAFDGAEPLDAAAVELAADRVRAFYRARGHADVRVEVEERAAPGTVRVVLHVDEGVRYRMASVTVQDAPDRGSAWVRARLSAYLDEDASEEPAVEADRVRLRLASVPDAHPPRTPPARLPPSQTWDGEAWDRAAERVLDLYRAEGWIEAVYLGSSVDLDARARSAAVTVRLREGPRYAVESISFTGNEVIGLSELARESRLAPGDPLSLERLEETRAALLRRYLAAGHLYARVEAREDLDRARHVAAIRFVVEEGPRVHLGRVVVSGNRRTRDRVVREALEVQEGQVYDPGAVARSQAALLRLGVFRSVELRLQEAELPATTKDLAVELAERPWATLSQGVGYSIANGPRATAEYTRPNLLGQALELTGRARVNYPVNTPWSFRPELTDRSPGEKVEGRVDLGLRSQRLKLGLPVPAGARTDAIAEILHRRAYDLRRLVGIFGVDAGVTSRATFSLQYELELDDIQKSSAAGFLTQADLERLRFDQGVTTLHAVRPTFSFDARDNSAHPHSGWFVSASAEWARSLGDGGRRVLGLLPGSDIHTNLVKLQATGSAYLPVGASVLALALRGGRVLPLDRDSKTIIPRRFFLGGAGTMRGFGEEEMIPEDVRADLASEGRFCATSPTGVGCTERGRRIAAGDRPVSEGGEAFILVKGELRLALSRAVELGVFVDLGNVWLDPSRYRLVDLRANAGAGIRFVTPIGPAALDLGFNLIPDRSINERIFAPHFTIGLF
jgi:outer membrane protein assembly complex protein YaeT